MPEEIQDLVVSESKTEISISRTPDTVLAEAKRAADSLKGIIAKKPKPVIIAGRQFLEFEDWAMIAKFYGVVAKVVDSHYVEFGEAKGFESTAVAFHINSGQEISKAFGMCTNDEKVDNKGTTRADWSLQRLRSFSQTRACSKVLKQVFSWVAVLGGYASVPAEEMTNDAIEPHNEAAHPKVSAPTQSGISDAIREIINWIGEMCGGEQSAMDEQLKQFTMWKDKTTKEEKWLTFDSLHKIALKSPDWIRKIHEKVGAMYSLQPKK